MTTDGALQRGKACLSCRRRKMRCDGVRPLCGQCVKANRTEDCEYTDQQGRTKTQLLEDDVARLEARLMELENPNEWTPSVTLHDPHMSRAGPSSSALVLQPTTVQLKGFESPPVDISDMLMNIFMTYASPLGFSLHPRFYKTIGLPKEHPLRPHGCLVNVIYLWGVRISSIQSVDVGAMETRFLSKASMALTDAMGSRSSVTRIHAIQAEVLLAQYFFHLGRNLEGRYHINAAVSLAMSSGLHLIRSATQQGAQRRTGSQSGRSLVPTAAFDFELAPPADGVEEGERVQLFWTVFCLDRCWAVEGGAPAIIADDVASGTQIDTPWPREVHEYEVMNLMQVRSSSRTVKNFLTRDPNLRWEGGNISSLLAQVSALFEYAARSVTQWQSGQIPPDQIQAEFKRLDKLIVSFSQTLIPPTQFETCPPQIVAGYTLIHSLVYAAQIKLHHACVEVNPRSFQACVVATRGVVSMVEVAVANERARMGPLIGVAWSIAASFLVRMRNRALSQVRQAHGSGRPGPGPSGVPQNANIIRLEGVEADMTRLARALSAFAAKNAVLATQVAAVLNVLQV